MSTSRHVCVRCGRKYSEADWGVLPALHVLGDAELRPLLLGTRRPVVEVKRCASCAVAMARLRPAAVAALV
jgi:hypothetical protein